MVFNIEKKILKTHLLLFACVTILYLYPASIIIITNITGDLGASRWVTIPVRIMVMMSFFFLLTISRLRPRWPDILLLLLFSSLYMLRVLVEVTTGARETYQSPIEFVLYYLSFFMIPCLVLSLISSDDIDWSYILAKLIDASWIFLLPVAIYYGSLVGVVQRAEEAVYHGGVWVNPLMLSYTATFIIVLLIASSRLPTRLRIKWWYGSMVLIFAMVPTLLGASRGSLVSLALVIFIYALSSGNALRMVTSLTFLSVVSVGVTAASLLYESGPVFRLIQTLSGESTVGENARLQRWSEGLDQFSKSPVFGDALVLNSSNNYPHNIFIEVLISTGILGAVVFSTYLVFIFRDLYHVLFYRERFWVIGIFLVAFVGANFSGNITNQAYLGLSIGLLNMVVRGDRASFNGPANRSKI